MEKTDFEIKIKYSFNYNGYILMFKKKRKTI